MTKKVIATISQPVPALSKQVGGDYYKDMAIQPMEFLQKNRLTWCEANIIKYVCRHHKKGGIKDLLKAMHYLESLIEMEYNNAD